MRTSVLTFNQERAVELGLSVEELLLLNWFVYFNGSEDALKFTLDDGVYIWVSYQKVLDDLPIIHCNKRNLATKFQHLSDAGVLVHKTLKQTGTMSAFRLGHEYSGLVLNRAASKSDEGSPKIDEGSLKSDDPLVQNQTTKDKELKNKDITPIAPKGETERVTYSERFERFWKSYPRKIGKMAAWNVFRRLKVDDALLDTMLRTLEAQKKSDDWKRDGGQYIPHPRTWLNQGRWEDSVDMSTSEPEGGGISQLW